MVAWANANHRVSLWNTHTLQPKHIGMSHNVPSLSFHPDGERIALALEWAVKIHDVSDRTERFSLKGHTGRVTCVIHSPDGKLIATASWDRTVGLWDSATGANRASFDWGIGRVFSLAFAPDGLRVAAGGEDGKIAVWDIE